VAFAVSVTVTVAVPASAAAGAAAPRQVVGGWYGYVATGSTYTSVSASWTVPTVDCATSSGDATIWVGLDGYGDATVEQIGTDVACSGGVAEYAAFFEMYPAYPVSFDNVVAPGDVIDASVDYTATNAFVLTISDTTQGWTRTTTQDATAARSSAEAVVEPGDLKLPPVRFTNVLVDGAPIATCVPIPVGGSPVSPLGSDGESFSVG
jgi:hypothetical protein